VNGEIARRIETEIRPIISSHRHKAPPTNLTSEDLADLAKCWISPEIADAAGLFRVTSVEGRELVGRNGGGDFSGLVFSYIWPPSGQVVLQRLRLDHPPIDAATGKAAHKYLSPHGARNRLYIPPCTAELLTSVQTDIAITEGEKKCLAMWRAACELTNGNGTLSFLPMAVSGVWNWRGTIGIRTNANGERVPEKGVIPDFDCIVWMGRKVTIVFDANAATNDSVRAARRGLAAELTRRGAEVHIADLPSVMGVNGIDDFLAVFGLEKGVALLDQAYRYDWRQELIRSERGKVLPNLANAITALRSAPEWAGALAFDEFSLRVTTVRDIPWGFVAKWSEQDDRLCADWMQHHGIQVSDGEVAKAVETVAREDRAYHPVREYLDNLKWDGIGRLDDWLMLYLGVEQSELARAFGSKWMISAVARVYEPGCKADHVLIVEGPQGAFKSSAFHIIAGDFFTDDVPDLSNKHASLATIGAWIIELPELDAMGRAELSRVKAFMSRATDRFRPPYGRRLIESPRQCVFVGTVNHSEYLRDETGGRRFWPVACGYINLQALRRDRDQLWAEAVARYRKGEHWWLETPAVVQAATEEQEVRYAVDPWEEPISKWLDKNPEPVTTGDLLVSAIQKPAGHWVRGDEMRVAAILRRLGWTKGPREGTGSRRRTYEPPPDRRHTQCSRRRGDEKDDQ
jgi:predicted P-loop ATPase